MGGGSGETGRMQGNVGGEATWKRGWRRRTRGSSAREAEGGSPYLSDQGEVGQLGGQVGQLRGGLDDVQHGQAAGT